MATVNLAIQTDFRNLNDPRRAPRHLLIEIIGIAICAVICLALTLLKRHPVKESIACKRLHAALNVDSLRESVSNKAHFYQSRDRKGAVFRAATERGDRFFAVLSPAPLRSRL